ncbi:hypothetical protein H8356DRAFT_1344921 [Neocallimastix lanati (nom. inval.)]|nr:hypothetical protein H8356DRAFT_1344921 [Neocallimastix sp. JGI-2020a]
MTVFSCSSTKNYINIINEDNNKKNINESHWTKKRNNKLISHCGSLNSEMIEHLTKYKEIHLLKLKGYNHWLDVINEILDNPFEINKNIIMKNLIGPIQNSIYGNKYILIILDDHSIFGHNFILELFNRIINYVQKEILNNTTELQLVESFIHPSPLRKKLRKPGLDFSTK